MININRHNYEEFFLLYADKELSVDHRMAVEQFVSENPDLAVELNLLLDATLSPADLFQMPDKESLFRNSADEIHLANYEERFIRYIDKELKTGEQEEIETFVLQHPELQEEFMLLKKTVLPAEQLIFPYKESLYRKEEERPKVIPIWFSWQRFVAAAVITGACFLTWNMLSNDNINDNGSTQQLTASSTQPANPIPASKKAPATIATEEQESSLVTGNEPAREFVASRSGSSSTNSNTTTVMASNNDLRGQTAANIVNPVTEDQSLITRNTLETEIVVSNSTAGITAETALPDKIASTKVAANTLVREEQEFTFQNAIDTDANDGLARRSAARPMNVVYKELDTDEDSENKSLLVGSVEINKDKLRGFFRKAASIFRGKPKQEEQKEKTIVQTSSRSLK